MAAVIATTCQTSGLDRLLAQPGAGDAVILLLPAGIDEPLAVTSLVTGLVWALRQANTRPAGGPALEEKRVRLRMAVHEGITILAAGSFAGRAVAKTCRLLGSPALRAALARSPRADLAVMLSDQVFEDISGFDRSLPLGDCERVEIEDPDGGASDVGWVFVPTLAR
jgi:hypothetical protein